MSRPISSARIVCYRLLLEIELCRIHSDDALNSDAMVGLSGRDRNLTTEIVYGTLRWQGLLDHVLSGVVSVPWLKVERKIKILLRMSLYQLWMLGRVPAYAVVNDAVEITKGELGKKPAAFVNGVLRNLVRTQPWKSDGFLRNAPAWVRVSMPEWLYHRWANRYGHHVAEEFALSLNAPPMAALRRLGKTSGNASFPFPVTQSDLVPGAAVRAGNSDFKSAVGEIQDRIHFQDEASQLIPFLPGVERGWKVWDACAAPGGKSAILAEICGESGWIVASDRNPARAEAVKRFLESIGICEPAVLVADAGEPAPFHFCFDAVLADVPCSGLGTLRRNPEIKWRFRPEEFPRLQEIQRNILENVSQKVRRGGLLLYSTCSTEPEENEEVIHSFLSRHPEFFLKIPRNPPGIAECVGNDGMVRTFPGKRRWDGFFAALMQRRP